LAPANLRTPDAASPTKKKGKKFKKKKRKTWQAGKKKKLFLKIFAREKAGKTGFLQVTHGPTGNL
jgi:hypothetical protein